MTGGGANTNTTAWQVYGGAVTVSLVKNGTASFDYYSVDTAEHAQRGPCPKGTDLLAPREQLERSRATR